MLKMSAMLSALSAAGSALGLLGQVLTAHLFGAGATVDAYYIALSVPTFVLGLMSAPITYLVVPKLVGLEHDPAERKRFAARLCAACFGVFGVLAGVFVLGRETFVRLVAAQIDAPSQAAVAAMTPFAWLASAGLLGIALGAAIGNAQGRYVSTRLAHLLPPLGLVCACSVAAGSIGVLALPIGTALGALAGALLIATVAARGAAARTPRDATRSGVEGTGGGAAAFVALIREVPLGLAASIAFVAWPLVDMLLATRMSAGELSYLGYAQRLLIAIAGLLVVGPFTLLGTRLAVLHRERRDHEFDRELRSALAGACKLAIPVALVIALLAEPAVRLAFERGAFDARASAGVAAALAIMLPGMVAMMLVTLMFRALFARGEIAIAARWSIVWLVLYACGGAIGASVGESRGVAIAYSIAWTVTAIGCARSTLGARASSRRSVA